MIGLIEFEMKNNWELHGDTVGAEAIARWLMDDVQFQKDVVGDWLRTISEESTNFYLGTGNSFSLNRKEKTIILENEYVGRYRVALAIEQFETNLKYFDRFLSEVSKTKK